MLEFCAGTCCPRAAASVASDHALARIPAKSPRMILLCKARKEPLWNDTLDKKGGRGRTAHLSCQTFERRFEGSNSRFKRSAAAFSAASGVFSGKPCRMCTYTNVAVSPLEYALTDH